MARELTPSQKRFVEETIKRYRYYPDKDVSKLKENVTMATRRIIVDTLRRRNIPCEQVAAALGVSIQLVYRDIDWLIEARRRMLPPNWVASRFMDSIERLEHHAEKAALEYEAASTPRDRAAFMSLAIEAETRKGTLLAKVIGDAALASAFGQISKDDPKDRVGIMQRAYEISLRNNGNGFALPAPDEMEAEVVKKNGDESE